MKQENVQGSDLWGKNATVNVPDRLADLNDSDTVVTKTQIASIHTAGIVWVVEDEFGNVEVWITDPNEVNYTEQDGVYKIKTLDYTEIDRVYNIGGNE